MVVFIRRSTAKHIHNVTVPFMDFGENIGITPFTEHDIRVYKHIHIFNNIIRSIIYSTNSHENKKSK